VRLLNTSDEATRNGQTKCKMGAQAHWNAIMDLSFSNDDMRLATACGDRSGRVLDVMTQVVAAELAGGHNHSMRRVEFQPGAANGNIIATSDRDATIQIWDLRIPIAPIHNFSTVGVDGTFQAPRNPVPFWAKTVNTVPFAHARMVGGARSSASVTAIQWLPPSREHLLLSASEANAVVKLWDTRYIKSVRQYAAPVCYTSEPQTHEWRPYGITSLAVSSDAARFYAVCKDNTVYAYSTSHLMLGHAPELSPNPPRKRWGPDQQGPGPLYGFKHENLEVGSFYVKCSIRKRHVTGTELLAVGSTDKCAVVFPTDERFLWDQWDRKGRPGPVRESGNTIPNSANASSPIPIAQNGIPLIRGHSREVTTVDWSNEGKLITSSDDYIVRHWQEGSEAAYLRTCGEFGGHRHMCGWADVGDDWDEEEDG
jgi:WD40 repeat protein